MTGASVYLTFNGNCGDAMRAYHQILGGNLSIRTHAESIPAAHITPGMADKIMHARLELGDTVIMASDGMPDSEEKMSGFSISLNYTDAAEAKKIFDRLAEGGKVTMPFAETFWSPGFGMLRDRFGTPWMVNTEQETTA